MGHEQSHKMKQYWTPLAKWLGISKAQQDSRPAASLAAEPPDLPMQDGMQSPWPDLHRALREHAQTEWVARSQRHADVNPDERLAITRLQIRASTPALDAQLQQWFAESEVPHLIQWLVRGPFKTATIERWVILNAFEYLEILPLQQNQTANASPYDVTYPEAKALPPAYVIVAETRWQPKPALTKPVESLPPLELIIQDASGERRVHMMQTLVVLGAEKNLKTVDGKIMRLRDQSPVDWHGETAWFLAVSAQHVSGMHLVLRLHEDGVDCLDAGSTNGSYVNGQALNPGNWHAVKHMETVFLGGPASDPRSHTARIELRVGHPVIAVGKDRTPLRRSAPQVMPPLITLQSLNDPDMAPVRVHALPFIIGRDADCDWVIPAHYDMVSRQHLVIEEVDGERQQVKLRDISRQGLSDSREGWRGDAAQGVWVACTDAITLGKTLRHPGLSFGFLGPLTNPTT
jgi:pSer/pThr/pTyr-binding forkhead associated (FHA) protein